jgi:hypothetical protein
VAAEVVALETAAVAVVEVEPEAVVVAVERRRP